jgi:hypothetical protein
MRRRNVRQQRSSAVSVSKQHLLLYVFSFAFQFQFQFLAVSGARLHSWHFTRKSKPLLFTLKSVWRYILTSYLFWRTENCSSALRATVAYSENVEGVGVGRLRQDCSVSCHLKWKAAVSHRVSLLNNFSFFNILGRGETMSLCTAAADGTFVAAHDDRWENGALL